MGSAQAASNLKFWEVTTFSIRAQVSGESGSFVEVQLLKASNRIIRLNARKD
jgi:hypothetical protein